MIQMRKGGTAEGSNSTLKYYFILPARGNNAGWSGEANQL